MPEQPVLILGETGTGKELAGKCIAGGRFIPFDKATRRFAAAPLAGARDGAGLRSSRARVLP